MSYPTARLRLTQLLMKLGLSGDSETSALSRDDVLAQVAEGTLTPEAAQKLLAEMA